MLVVLALYIYSYYRYPKITSIIQSHIRMFKPEILLAKQPIVIDDNDIDLQLFKSKLFSYNPTQLFTLSTSESWYKNKHKYVILQSNKGPVDILLCNPNFVDSKTNTPIENKTNDTNNADAEKANANTDTDAEIVEVQLSEGQILIIPFNWLYFIQNSTIECVGIHDYITYFLP